MAEERTLQDGGLRWYRLDEPSDTATGSDGTDVGACSYCGEPIEDTDTDSMRRIFSRDEQTGLEEELRLHGECYVPARGEAAKDHVLIENVGRTRTA